MATPSIVALFTVLVPIVLLTALMHAQLYGLFDTMTPRIRRIDSVLRLFDGFMWGSLCRPRSLSQSASGAVSACMQEGLPEF